MSEDLECQSSGILGAAVKGGTRDWLATGWQNELHVSQFLPRFSRLTELGVVYSTGMVLTSISNATFNTTTGLSATLGTAATATPIVGLYNPLSNANVNCHILQAHMDMVITALQATGCGGFVWAVFQGQNAITVASQAVPVNNKTFLAAGSSCKGLSGLALTGLTTIGAFLRASGLNSGSAYNASLLGTAAGFATTASPVVENIDGGIVVPPGGILALFCTTTPVAHSAAVSLTWAELPS